MSFKSYKNPLMAADYFHPESSQSNLAAKWFDAQTDFAAASMLQNYQAEVSAVVAIVTEALVVADCFVIAAEHLWVGLLE